LRDEDDGGRRSTAARIGGVVRRLASEESSGGANTIGCGAMDGREPRELPWMGVFGLVCLGLETEKKTVRARWQFGVINGNHRVK
jgi:hypothetical protein